MMSGTENRIEIHVRRLRRTLVVHDLIDAALTAGDVPNNTRSPTGAAMSNEKSACFSGIPVVSR
jgi:hypothetical protein